VYNPYLENLPRKTTRYTEFKIYDVDGGPGELAGPGNAREIMAAAAHAQGKHRETGHNDRFYEEQEYDKRVTRRRARLTVAAEEAFCHIKRMQLDSGS